MTEKNSPEYKRCRSVSPDGVGCIKRRGHVQMRHDDGTRLWNGGIGKPAQWIRLSPERLTPLEDGQCPSAAPDGTACGKPYGHKKRHRASSGGQEWTGGFRVMGSWHVPDDGHMSEADYQIRYLYGI